MWDSVEVLEIFRSMNVNENYALDLEWGYFSWTKSSAGLGYNNCKSGPLKIDKGDIEGEREKEL